MHNGRWFESQLLYLLSSSLLVCPRRQGNMAQMLGLLTHLRGTQSSRLPDSTVAPIRRMSKWKIPVSPENSAVQINQPIHSWKKNVILHKWCILKPSVSIRETVCVNDLAASTATQRHRTPCSQACATWGWILFPQRKSGGSNNWFSAKVLRNKITYSCISLCRVQH